MANVCHDRCMAEARRDRCVAPSGGVSCAGCVVTDVWPLQEVCRVRDVS